MKQKKLLFYKLIRRVALNWILVAFLLVLAASNSRAQEIGQKLPGGPLPPNYSQLVQKAQNNGVVPVIVGLNLPTAFQPEGNLSHDAVEAQRAAIFAMRQKLLNSLTGYQVDAYTVYKTIPYLAMNVDEAALRTLIASPLVASIREDVPVPATLASSTVLIGMPCAWGQEINGAGQTVVILDTGIDENHPFFGERLVYEACFSNGPGGGQRVSLCPNGQKTQYGLGAANAEATQCWNGGQTTQLCDHGTHVAGIAAGNDYAGGPGYSGVAPGANIIAIQAFTRFNRDSECGGYAPCVSSWTSDQILALEYVYDTLRSSYMIPSVNMSLGGGQYTNQATCDSDNSDIKAAIDNLRSVGIATIISSGNNGWTNAMSAPGCVSSAVGIGSTTDTDEVSGFSNMHAMVDLLAPGSSIDSSIPNNTWDNFNGTSMSAPHVTGAWAVLKSVKPAATVDEVLAAFQNSGVSVTDRRCNGTITKPRIQVDAAIAELNPATWTGNTSTSWSTASNWSTAVAPSCVANVTIPTLPSGGRFPTVDADSTVRNLTIQTGAQVNMSINTLNVLGDWNVQGTGQFNATGGTVVFEGSNAQAITMMAGSNGWFNHLSLGDGSTPSSVTANSHLDVNGNLTIRAGATWTAGANTISVAGNWADYGTFSRGTSTVIFDGTTQVAGRQVTYPANYYLTSEGFEGSFPPTNWVVYKTGDPSDPGWNRGQCGTTESNGPPHSGTYYAWHNDDQYIAAVSWLRTPQIALPAGSSPILSFWQRSYWAAYYNYHGVWVCTANCTSPPTNYTELWNGGTSDSWLQKTIDLSGYVGHNVYLAFRYAGNYADEWYIDDVAVYSMGTSYDLQFYNLIVNGNDNVMTLNGNVTIDNDLTIGNGATLDMGTYTITGAGGSVTNNGGLRQTRDTPQSTTTAFLNIDTDKYYGVDIYPTTGSMGSTTVTVYGNQTCAGFDTAVQRCFEITPGASPAPMADVTFYYRDAEENEQAAAKAFHYNGFTWDELTSSRDRSGTEDNWVKATGVASYSPFGLGNNGPLAVELAGFEAAADGAAIRLEWETASELDNVGFNLYRSQALDGAYAQLNTALIPAQNPGGVIGALYAWRDSSVLPGATYYYKLEDIDIHGTRTLHGPVWAAASGARVYRVYLPVLLKP